MQTLFAPSRARGIFLRPHFQTSLLCANKSSVTFTSTFSRNSLVQFSHLNYKTVRRIKSQHSIVRLQAIQASEAAGPLSPSEKWEFQFVGDGNTSHIGQAASLPSTFELASDTATIGRLPEKADIVIPVATVSAVHARLEKKEGMLFVTDLNSTNGTYVDEKKLSPGVATPLSPQSCITFGVFAVCAPGFGGHHQNGIRANNAAFPFVESSTSLSF
ncbi:uncharacterized protein LOC131077114 isoform X2 [Cryptomeria japonica]|uniref:uncharacterized protein LOC131077114 isoform X2 n=1 Tax=Cryptomeria japonica TaxID=3369 RepID=UPI0027DA1EEB|nr:uncharacterized protein LOC131077114 isoform X2 [Cryptomeria japonica]